MEYRVLNEGFCEEREFWASQTRDVCFYTITPHLAKNSSIRKPSDMWIVNRHEAESRQSTGLDPNNRKERTRRKAMKAELAKIGIDFV